MKVKIYKGGQTQKRIHSGENIYGEGHTPHTERDTHKGEHTQRITYTEGNKHKKRHT